MNRKVKKALNWLSLVMAIAFLLAVNYCLLTLAVWFANVVPE